MAQYHCTNCGWSGELELQGRMDSKGNLMDPEPCPQCELIWTLEPGEGEKQWEPPPWRTKCAVTEHKRAVYKQRH